MLPITPQEAMKSKATNFPEFVIEAFNKMIQQHLTSSGVAKFSQAEVVETILLNHAVAITKQEIFDKGYLDVERLYRAHGWEVDYDKPGYNEKYHPFFTFRIKEPSWTEFR